MYTVKEIYCTLQGEGYHTGRTAVFCRFAGCNLWSGHEATRAKAVCQFCDTDFVGTDGEGGGRFARAQDLAKAIVNAWPSTRKAPPFVVCTGGEPLLQLDSDLVTSLHDYGCQIAIETNGTLLPPKNIDWICVSPKAGAPWRLKKGNELKLVYPQKGFSPRACEKLAFDYFYIQPMDGDATQANIKASVNYCKQNPQWRLSLQTHKSIGIK